MTINHDGQINVCDKQMFVQCVSAFIDAQLIH